MRHRFRAWMLLVFVPLLLATALGQLVEWGIMPRDIHTDMFAPAAVRVVGGQVVNGPADRGRVMNNLLHRGPTAFNTAAKPTPSDTGEFDRLMAELTGGQHWVFQHAVNGYRAAEEWGPLGAFSRTPDIKPTLGTLEDEATAYQEVVRKLAEDDKGRPFGSRSVRAVSIARAKVGTEVRIIARHSVTVNDVEEVWYTRWFLTRLSYGNGWAVYDFDEPVGRTRLTVRRAGEITGRRKGFPDAPVEGFGQLLIDGMAAARDGDAAKVRAVSAAFREAELIPALTAARLVLDGHAELLADHPAAALTLFQSAVNTSTPNGWADTPAALIGQAEALNRLDRPAEALKMIARYREQIGNGPEAFREEARAKRAAKDLPAAVEAAKAGLKETPDDPALLAELYYALPADRKKEAGEAAARAARPGPAVSALIARLEAAQGGLPPADAAAVADEFQKLQLRDPEGFYEAGLARLRQNRPDAALERFQAGRKKAKGRAELVPVLTRAARLLKPADVYRAVGGADYEAAMEAAAAALQPKVSAGDKDAIKELKAVAALHRAKVPADPWGDFHAAEAAIARTDWAAADPLLAEGMKKLRRPTFPDGRPQPDDSVAPGQVVLVPNQGEDGATWERFRSRRALVLFRLGRWQQAHADLPPAVATFDQLAELMMAANDADGLLALAAVHAKAVPSDPAAAAVRADGHWRKGQPEPAASAAAEYLNNPDPLHTYWRTAIGIRVRALVRLNRADEARQELEQVWRHPEEQATAAEDDRITREFVLRALVVAADGPDVLLAWFAEDSRAARHTKRYYADPDLGPRLRAAEFEPFRAKYPPPPK